MKKVKSKSTSVTKKTIPNSGNINKRKKKGKERQYTLESLKEALNAIGKGVTLGEAAKHYGIPKTTLFAKFHHRSPLECSKGPQTVLGKEIEDEILNWIIYKGERGFPVVKSELLDNIQKYLTDTKQKTVFKNNRPGKHWYTSFMARHPELSIRIAQNLTSTRAEAVESRLRKWYDKVLNNLKNKDLLNIEPSRVFNLDESAFSLVPKDNYVITKRGAKSVYRIVSGADKAALTVLFIASADGKMLPPMIVYDCKTTPRRQTLSKIPADWVVGNTESGWMTAETFYHYILNGFIPSLKKNKVKLKFWNQE